MAVLVLMTAVPALSVAATEGDQTVSDENVTTLADTAAAEADTADADSDATATEPEKKGKEKAPTYASYLVTYTDEGAEGGPVAVRGDDAASADTNNEINLPFTAETAGYYTLSFDYAYAVAGNKNTSYDLKIDGKLPFQEAASRKFARIWTNEFEVVDAGEADDINPKQIEAEGYWRSYTLYDKEGYYHTPMEFYLEKGAHTLTFAMSTDHVQVKNVTFNRAAELPTYSEYLKAQSSATKYSGSESLAIEGEKALYKSEMYLIAQNDITNPVTQPYSPAFIKLNTFGGANWKLTGETAYWEVEAEEAGLYKLAIRYRQNFYDGVSSHRRLYVNGEVPFAEANALQFPYSTNWETFTMKDAEGEDLYIYLNKGVNTIGLEVMLGSSAKIAEELQETVLEMNNIYRQIIMITGSSPDDFRDYNITEQIPNLVGDLEKVTKKLRALKDEVAAQYGDGTSLIAKIDNIIRQMDQLIEKPKQIAKSDRLGAFKSNISTIGSWISMFTEQPLEIDVIDFYGENSTPRKAQADFFEGFGHTYNRFVASFTQDYSSVATIGDSGETSETITVWIQSGRDQANVLKQLITSSFTKQTGIGVNLELVTGAIIEATLAGRGPDVALSRPVTDPVNFAMRGALYDLSKFDDYDEVVKSFTCDDEGNPIAMIPFEYKDGVYALPETQTYQMMFVRQDILEELGFVDDAGSVIVPTSWDQLLTEFYPIVSRNNMEIGIGNMNQISAMNASNIFTNLLYQMGGQIYNDEGTATALRTQVAHNAFKTSVELYADYLFPQEYDAMSRFRTGEMPILLADYTMYNVFALSIPELDGLWEMYPIPGVLQEDGTINNVQAATSTASVMFNTEHTADDEAPTAKQKACWEFLKWWTSKETQAEFGTRIEAILGSGGRYATANEAAMVELPWDDKQLDALTDQMENLVFVEQLPGSYFTSRAINSAFMTSVLNSENPSEQLVYWSEQIDKELTRKIEEFAD